MAKLFLSYRHVEPDETISKSLYDSLRANGHSVFRDTQGLQAGDAWDPRLQAEIEKADFFVALVSLAYLNSPYIVDHELANATKRWKAGRLERLLFVNLSYAGDPPAAAEEVLREVQFLEKKWRSPKDTVQVAEEILRVLPPDEVLVRGMRFFDISDARAFARLGREEEIARFLSLLRAEDAAPILLYGVSGAGKTSFLRAGVLPALDGRGTIVEMTGLPSDPVPVPGEPGGVLIFDAFERLLRSAAAASKAPATAAALAAWAQPAAGMRQVFALRAEYWPAFDSMLPEVAARCTRFPLLPLAPEKAAAVLGLLLESVRLDYDESLLLPLCEELADGVPKTVRPALLQILSQALQRRGEKVTQGIWDRVKSAGDSLLQEHIRETVLDRVPARVGGSRAIEILDGLTYGVFRSSARTVAEIAAGRKISPPDVQETLETAALPHARVVVPEPGEGEVRYRLIHDLFASSVKALRGTMSLQAERRRRRRQVLTLSSLLAVAVLALGLAVFFGFLARQGAQRSRDALLLRAFEDAMNAGDSTAAFLLVRDTQTDDRLPEWLSAAVAALQNPLPVWQADERMLGVEPEGRSFLSLTPSGRLLVRSVEDPRLAIELGSPEPLPPDGDPSETVWSRDARHVAVSWRNGTYLWDVQAPAAPLLRGPGKRQVAFDANGSLAVIAQDRELETWLLGPKVTRAHPTALLDGSITNIVCGETPQRCFALADSDHSELWDVTSAAPRKIRDWEMYQHVSLDQWSQVLSVDHAAAGPRKMRVEVTSLKELRPPVSVDLEELHAPDFLAAGRDGRFLLETEFPGDGGRLWAADLRDPSSKPIDLTSFVNAPLPGYCEVHLADRADVIALSFYGFPRVVVFDLAHPERSQVVNLDDVVGKESIALSPDGEWLAISNRLLHLSDRRWTTLKTSGPNEGAALTDIHFDPASRRLSGRAGGHILIAELKRPEVSYWLNDDPGASFWVGSSSDGLLTWSAETIRRWDLGTLPGDFGQDTSIRRGSLPLKQQSEREPVTVWDEDLKKKVAEYPPPNRVLDAVPNDSGNFAGILISALGSESIEIWSLADPEHPALADRFPLQAPADSRLSLALSDDGKTVVAYGRNLSLLFSPRHRTGVPLGGATSQPTFLTISRSGQRILATLENGTVALWDVAEPDRPILVMRRFPFLLDFAQFGATEDKIDTITEPSWTWPRARTWDISQVGLRKALDETSSSLCLTVRQREHYLQERRTEAEDGFRTCEREHSRGK